MEVLKADAGNDEVASRDTVLGRSAARFLSYRDSRQPRHVTFRHVTLKLALSLENKRFRKINKNKNES